MLTHLETEHTDSDSLSVSDVTTPSSDTQSLSSEPVDMEMAQQEEQAISEKIRSVQERRWVDDFCSNYY